jgi:hypothetical protein
LIESHFFFSSGPKLQPQPRAVVTVVLGFISWSSSSSLRSKKLQFLGLAGITVHWSS